MTLTLSRGLTTMDAGWKDLAPAALVFVFGALIVFPIYFGVKAAVRRALRKPLYCLACGSTRTPKPHYRGSSLAEAALWDLLVVPGIIYSGWRLKARRMVCGACGSEQIVPLDSPRAKADAKRRADVDVRGPEADSAAHALAPQPRARQPPDAPRRG